MSRTRKLERKPLSFSTTMRNPERIAEFVESLAEFEGKILTNKLIKEIIIKWIINKLIRSDSVFKIKKYLKDIYNDKGKFFSKNQAEFIYTETERITKGHKEAGFDKGWPSRFDTYLRLPMEFGFIFYKIGYPIEISETGKLLISSNKQLETEKRVIRKSDVFLNALSKYQTNNPFRRNLIDNAPFVLFLETVKQLKRKYYWNKTGIYRGEIPFVICWPNNDSVALAEFISNFRQKNGKLPSNEIVYEECLMLLQSNNRKRFKLKQITKESVDDFIRKLRITGLISLRGGGRLIDINSFEIDKADYIIQEYADYEKFADEHSYYEYMGSIDTKLIDTYTVISEKDIKDIKQRNLANWANKMETKQIAKEFKDLTSKTGSSDPILKFINAPTRFEFLMSIALKHQYPSLDIRPNYSVDDEGMPTFTARGGIGDIEVFGKTSDILVEVTLMQNKSQSTNEIPGITRHLKEFKRDKSKDVFALFVAPSIHEDTKYMIDFSRFHDSVSIYSYTIKAFVSKWSQSYKIQELENSSI